MSHQSPFRPTLPLAHSSPARPSGTNAAAPVSYTHLHATHGAVESESDDDMDPRWTHPKLVQQATAAAASPSARREGQQTARSLMQQANFTRTGYVPTAGVVENAIGTMGIAGQTSLRPEQVREAWTRGIGVPAAAASPLSEDGAHGSGIGVVPNAPFSGVPVPHVDLTGMTDEQRELLEYYQARIDAFERERVDFLQRLDEMAGSSKEKHSLKWDLHKKDQQIMDLQKALSDAHVFLYEERAQVLKLTAENDRLKSKPTPRSGPDHADTVAALTVRSYVVSLFQSKNWKIVSVSSTCSPLRSLSTRKSHISASADLKN
jgi:hypothetical protein